MSGPEKIPEKVLVVYGQGAQFADVYLRILKETTITPSITPLIAHDAATALEIIATESPDKVIIDRFGHNFSDRLDLWQNLQGYKPRPKVLAVAYNDQCKTLWSSLGADGIIDAPEWLNAIDGILRHDTRQQDTHEETYLAPITK